MHGDHNTSLIASTNVYSVTAALPPKNETDFLGHPHQVAVVVGSFGVTQES